MVRKRIQISKLLEEISKTCTLGSILHLFSTLNLIMQLKLKIKLQKKRRTKIFAATVKLQTLNLHFVKIVNQESTAQITVKHRTNKPMKKNVKKYKGK